MLFRDTAQYYCPLHQSDCFGLTDSHSASPKLEMAFAQLQTLFHSNVSGSILSWNILFSALCATLVYLLSINLRSYWRLSHIPGPFFAALTNIQRMLWVKSYRAHEIHIELHRKYGPIVRFGPNMISVADPEEIGTIYSFKKPWPKVHRPRFRSQELGY